MRAQPHVADRMDGDPSMSEQLETVQTEPTRDRFGRPKVTPPGGGEPVPYTRCTTYVSALEDTWNLSKWQQRMVAAGIAQRADLQLRAASLGLQPQDGERAKWRKQMDEVTEAAAEAAQAHAAATIGTSVHALTERLDRGLDVGVVPEQYKPHLNAYQTATADFTALHIEQFTVHDDLQIGGTPDRILRIPGHDKNVIGDIKTGTVKYGVGKMAMQLAVYAHSLLYDINTGQRTSLDNIDQDWGLIVALSAETGQCDLLWINIAAGWEAVQIATQVRAWRKRKDLTQQYRASPPTPAAAQPLVTVTEDTPLIKAITKAATVDELVEVWRQADRQGLWVPELNDAAARRKQQLQASA